MSVSNLYLIESGKAQTLPEETLKRLSDAIGFDFVSEVYRIACGVGHNEELRTGCHNIGTKNRVKPEMFMNT